MSAILSRPSPRTAFRRYVRLDCQVVREHDFKIIADLAFDLSTEGMLVSTRERVLSGEEVIVSFKPPKSNRWVDAQATVARVIHGRRPTDRGRSLGLTFHAMDPMDKEHLWEALRGLAAPEPARDPRIGIASRLA
jgi:hypothetical protein